MRADDFCSLGFKVITLLSTASFAVVLGNFAEIGFPRVRQAYYGTAQVGHPLRFKSKSSQVCGECIDGRIAEIN